jgi:hypothetical protein
MAPKVIFSIFPLVSAGFEVNFVPFHDFIADVQTSTFADVMSSNGASGFSVRDEFAFNEMRQHIISHYEGVNVTHSFLDVHHFDCVTVESQPSLRGRNWRTPPPLEESSQDTANVQQQFATAVPCAIGTIPMLRVNFDRVLRHPTLDHFFAKSPHGPAEHPVGSITEFGASASIPHKYAHAYQSVANGGGSSSLGLWNPQGDFTLSQQWYSAYTQGKKVQTAECGNLHYPAKFGSNAVLFLYRTNNGYASGSGCYNLDCTGFVQTDHSIALGKAWSTYSSDGHRTASTFSYRLYNDAWWFSVDGKNIGYYPTSIYKSVDATAMAVGATKVDFGGETTHTQATDDWPQMGSGKFANAGYSHAASHTIVRYFTPDGKYYNNATLSTSQHSSSCYTIVEHEHDTNAGTWFSFGGPGGAYSGCNSNANTNVLV